MIHENLSIGTLEVEAQLIAIAKQILALARGVWVRPNLNLDECRARERAGACLDGEIAVLVIEGAIRVHPSGEQTDCRVLLLLARFGTGLRSLRAFRDDALARHAKVDRAIIGHVHRFLRRAFWARGAYRGDRWFEDRRALGVPARLHLK
jgi:hypothetical protein